MVVIAGDLAEEEEIFSDDEVESEVAEDEVEGDKVAFEEEVELEDAEAIEVSQRDSSHCVGKSRMIYTALWIQIPHRRLSSNVQTHAYSIASVTQTCAWVSTE